jgi:hypothetical protein
VVRRLVSAGRLLRCGRLGGDGRDKTRRFADGLVAEELGKGYREAGAGEARMMTRGREQAGRG